MTMTRKDFEAVASAIADIDMAPGTVDTAKSWQSAQEGIRQQYAMALADALVSQSDSFDPVRFIEACGVDLPEVEIAAYSTRLDRRINGRPR